MFAKAFFVSERAFAEAFGAILPGFLKEWSIDMFGDQFSQKSIGATWVSVIALLWSASKCVYYIIGGLNTIFELKERRKFLIVRLLSMLYMFVFVIAVIFTMLLMVFGSNLVDYAISLFPAFADYFVIILAARYSITFLVLTVFFSVLFKVLPATFFSFKDMLPGAIISSIGWISFSLIFELYIENFANYANLYGGITSIILFMLWLYFCMLILFFGAEVNLMIFRLKR